MRIRQLALLLSIFSLSLAGCTSIDDSQSDKTVTINGFEKIDDGFLGKIDNNVETFSFINKVNVPKNATWSIYSDISGKVEIPTKTIECNIGDNYVYLLVNNQRESIGFYKVDVYRYHMYTVSFNTNGGNNIKSQRVQEESFASKPNDPSKRGYTFSGWDYDFSRAIVSNLTINASWSLNSYTVTLDPNGGEISKTSVEISYGTYCTNDNGVFPIPTRTGYDFIGWSYNGRIITPFNFEFENDITLVAEWNKTNYQITYVLNGGTNHPDNPSFYNYDSPKIILKDPSYDGCTFEGWFNGETKITEIDSSWEADLTIVAKWKANSYTVSLDVNGGDPLDSTTLTAVFNSELILPTPTKTGYAFAGWYDQNNKLYQSGTWKTPGNVSLIAKWNANKYTLTLKAPNKFTNCTITYVYHDNENTVEEVLLEKGTAYSLPIPTRDDGYEFAGWSTVEGDSSHIVNFRYTIIKESITLHGRWIQSPDGKQLTLGNKEYYSYNPEGGGCRFYFVVPTTGFVRLQLLGNIVDSSEAKIAVNGRYTGVKASHSDICNAGDIITFSLRSGGRFYANISIDPEYLTVHHTSGSDYGLTVTYDSPFDLGSAVSEGKTFIGWFTEENGSGIQLTDSFGKSLSNWNYLTDLNAYPYFQ